MPVPAQVRGAAGDGDDVPQTLLDFLLASGTQVRLTGLERVHLAHLDVVDVVHRGSVVSHSPIVAY